MLQHVLNSILLLKDVPLFRYHIFFIPSSADRHLGCFHFLDIMNNGDIKFLYGYLYGHMFSFILDLYQGVELLDNMVILWLTFFLFTFIYFYFI